MLTGLLLCLNYPQQFVYLQIIHLKGLENVILFLISLISSNPAVTLSPLSEHKEKGISVLQDDKRRIVNSTCAILQISSLVHNFHNSSIFLVGPKGEPGPPGPKGSSGT